MKTIVCLPVFYFLAAIAVCGSPDRLPAAEPEHAYRLATFSADVTCPIGHPLIAGLAPDAVDVVDPLLAKGFVFLGAGKPVVFVSVDWCEIRNEAHDRWREVLAEAAGTTADRVMVSSIHQHDAPVMDLEAEKI